MATAAPMPQQRDRDTIVAKAWDAQERLETRLSNLGKGKYGRVLRMARKPTPEEYRKSATVAAVGIGVLGLIGFIIFYIMKFIPQS